MEPSAIYFFKIWVVNSAGISGEPMFTNEVSTYDSTPDTSEEEYESSDDSTSDVDYLSSGGAEDLTPDASEEEYESSDESTSVVHYLSSGEVADTSKPYFCDDTRSAELLESRERKNALDLCSSPKLEMVGEIIHISWDQVEEDDVTYLIDLYCDDQKANLEPYKTPDCEKQFSDLKPLCKYRCQVWAKASNGIEGKKKWSNAIETTSQLHQEDISGQHGKSLLSDQSSKEGSHESRHTAQHLLTAHHSKPTWEGTSGQNPKQPPHVAVYQQNQPSTSGLGALQREQKDNLQKDRPPPSGLVAPREPPQRDWVYVQPALDGRGSRPSLRRITEAKQDFTAHPPAKKIRKVHPRRNVKTSDWTGEHGGLFEEIGASDRPSMSGQQPQQEQQAYLQPASQLHQKDISGQLGKSLLYEQSYEEGSHNFPRPSISGLVAPEQQSQKEQGYLQVTPASRACGSRQYRESLSSSPSFEPASHEFLGSFQHLLATQQSYPTWEGYPTQQPTPIGVYQQGSRHKIREGFKLAQESFREICSSVDKKLADLMQAKLPVSDEAELLHEVAETYLFIGRFEQCVGAAKQGIDLLTKRKQPDQHSKLALLSLFCCITEAYIRTFNSEPAIENFTKARNILSKLPYSTPNYKGLSDRIENLSSIFMRFQRERACVAQSIGPDGGVLKLPDCTIYFPKRAVSSHVLMHAALRYPVANTPNGRILVSPVLCLMPTMKLEAPAQVQLATWLVSPGSNGVKICHRETENSQWEEIRATPTLKRRSVQDIIEFEIEKFCQYAPYVDEDGNGIYKVVSLLFYDPARKIITNKFSPKSETTLSSIRDITKGKGFKEACTEDPILEVALNDKIEVIIQNFRFLHSKCSAESMKRRLEINLNFLKGVEKRAMDFQLPFEASGGVEFTHKTKKVSAKGCLTSPEMQEIHENDRIILDRDDHEDAKSLKKNSRNYIKKIDKRRCVRNIKIDKRRYDRHHRIMAQNFANKGGKIKSKSRNAKTILRGHFNTDEEEDVSVLSDDEDSAHEDEGGA